LTLEAAIQEAVEKAVAPLTEQMRAQAAELRQLRRVLPPTMGSKKQAAQIMGVSEKTIARAIDRGEIDVTRIGSRVLIDLSKLKPAGEDEAEQPRVAGGRR
jgi:excisionase family DNA binding protein